MTQLHLFKVTDTLFTNGKFDEQNIVPLILFFHRIKKKGKPDRLRNTYSTHFLVTSGLVLFHSVLNKLKNNVSSEITMF